MFVVIVNFKIFYCLQLCQKRMHLMNEPFQGWAHDKGFQLSTLLLSWAPSIFLLPIPDTWEKWEHFLQHWPVAQDVSPYWQIQCYRDPGGNDQRKEIDWKYLFILQMIKIFRSKLRRLPRRVRVNTLHLHYHHSKVFWSQGFLS